MEKSHTAHRPSTLGAFFQGFKSGAINSALMLGIFKLVTMAFALPAIGVALPAIGWAAMAATIITTGLFSGAMGAKKAHDVAADESHARTHAKGTEVMLIPTQSPTIVPMQEVESNAMETRSDWADRTGRSSNTQTKVQQILANGSMSDKDRASAILAAREASTNSASIV